MWERRVAESLFGSGPQAARDAHERRDDEEVERPHIVDAPFPGELASFRGSGWWRLPACRFREAHELPHPSQRMHHQFISPLVCLRKRIF